METQTSPETKFCARCKKKLPLEHFPCQRVIRRRQPWGTIPMEITDHGFVADLITQVKEAAMGLPVTFHQKNGDWYLQIRIPDKGERDEMDRATAADTAPLPSSVDFFELGKSAIGSVIDSETGDVRDVPWDEAYEYLRATSEDDNEPFQLPGDLTAEQESDFRRGYAGKGKAADAKAR